jgi:hypothetical protein
MPDFRPRNRFQFAATCPAQPQAAAGIQLAARLGNSEYDYNCKRCRRKEILAYKNSEFESAGARKQLSLKHRRMAATTTDFVFKPKQTFDRQRFLVLCALSRGPMLPAPVPPTIGPPTD